MDLKTLDARDIGRMLAAANFNLREFSAAIAEVGDAAALAAAGFDSLAAQIRQYRFDHLYGPIIGGLVILGTLVAAALAAYYGG